MEFIDIENIEQEITSENSTEKNYLKELFSRLEYLKENDKTVSFVIQEQEKKGFLIKVGGLFGHIDIRYFPWHYRNRKVWDTIAPLLVGHKFYGKIKQLNSNPIYVEMFGKVHLFENFELEKGRQYKAIVVHRYGFGVQIELGSFYDWKYGSIFGFAHKLSFKNEESFEVLKVGDIITTYFQRTDFDKDPVFGELSEEEAKDLTELESYIGTIQTIIVRKDENEYRHFNFDRKYFGQIPITKINYGNQNNRQKVRNFLKGLETGQEIECEILGIIPKKKKFLLKLTDKQIEQID